MILHTTFWWKYRFYRPNFKYLLHAVRLADFLAFTRRQTNKIFKMIFKQIIKKNCNEWNKLTVVRNLNREI